jgi:capsular exopolysaccharide synthesis family protein
MVLCVILVPVGAYLVSSARPKEYQASATLLFRDPGLDQKLFGSTFVEPSRDPTREAATNAALVSLQVVADRAARMLPGHSGGEIARKVKVHGQGQANLASVVATDREPERAAQIANVFADEYIAFRREADQSKIRNAQRLIEHQLARLTKSERAGSQGRALRERADQLQLLGSLQTGNAELVQRASAPTAPTSPRVFRDTAVGVVLGILMAIAVALGLERLDTRIRDAHEAEEIFGRPILGTVPQTRALDMRQRAGLPSGPHREAFLLLRANLRYFNVGDEVNSVLVTSAAPGDGKSTIGSNLAIAIAMTEGRALLIEADMRNPVLNSYFGTHATRGLSSVLAGYSTLEEAVRTLEVPQSKNPDGEPLTVDVLFAGAIPPNPADLIDSERMRSLIAEAESNYDLVVIDTPPTSIVSDAIPLVRHVDGILVVVRLGKGTRDAAKKLQQQLHNLHAAVLGVVVNGGSGPGGYRYGYGYDSQNGRGKRNGSAADARNGSSPGVDSANGPSAKSRTSPIDQ